MARWGWHGLHRGRRNALWHPALGPRLQPHGPENAPVLGLARGAHAKPAASGVRARQYLTSVLLSRHAQATAQLPVFVHV